MDLIGGYLLILLVLFSANISLLLGNYKVNNAKLIIISVMFSLEKSMSTICFIKYGCIVESALHNIVKKLTSIIVFICFFIIFFIFNHLPSRS